MWGCDPEMQAPSPEPGTPLQLPGFLSLGTVSPGGSFFPPFIEAVVIVRGTLNFLPRTALYFSTL